MKYGDDGGDGEEAEEAEEVAVEEPARTGYKTPSVGQNTIKQDIYCKNIISFLYVSILFRPAKVLY